MTRVAAPEPTTAFVSAGLRHMVGRRVRRGGSGPPRTCPPHGRRSTHEAQPRPAHHEPVHLVAGDRRVRGPDGRGRAGLRPICAVFREDPGPRTAWSDGWCLSGKSRAPTDRPVRS